MEQKMKIKEINTQTGEEIIRDANAEEIAQSKLDKLEGKKLAEAEADKALAKASAQAKLAALGLTEEEVASILG